jgi:PAS domain S-box-containing protein
METKPTYEELEKRAQQLERVAIEWKRTEEKRRKSEETARALLNAPTESALLIDTEGAILALNETAHQRLGNAMEGLVGVNYYDLLQSTVAKDSEQRVKEVIRTGNPIRFEDERDGQHFDNNVYPVFDTKGKVGRIAVFSHDITDRKRAQETLQKMNEDLKDFMHIVSHDMKTPIYAISGFSSLMLKYHHEELGEECLDCVNHIKINARRMEVLISDLGSLLRLGRVASTFKDVASLEIVRNTTSALQGRLKEKGINLLVADKLPTINCDEEKIYQVFDNLLTNAIKFVGNTENPEIEIRYEDKEEAHHFSVRDNGIGIDPQHHQRIFEMFHRLKVIEDEEGTGLGLAIVERIVNHHGGKVWVESEKGKGATFHFTVPKAPSPVRLL